MDLIVYESLQVEIICEVLLYLHSKLYRPINYSHCNYERENKKLLGRNLDSKKEIKIDQKIARKKLSHWYSGIDHD